MAAFIAITMGVKGMGIGKAKTKGVKLNLQQGMPLLMSSRMGGGGNEIPTEKEKSNGVGSCGKGGNKAKVIQGPELSVMVLISLQKLKLWLKTLVMV